MVRDEGRERAGHIGSCGCDVADLYAKGRSCAAARNTEHAIEMETHSILLEILPEEMQAEIRIISTQRLRNMIEDWSEQPL
jgi:hypothetical protein